MDLEPKRKPGARKRYLKGRSLMLAGVYAEALEVLDSAIEVDLTFAAAYFCRGACHYRLGNYRQAGLDLEAASILGCEDAQLWSRFERSDHCPDQGAGGPEPGL